MNTANHTETIAERLRRPLFALIVCLLLLTFSFTNPASTAYAKKPKYSTIKILTMPGGLPIEIDGKSVGQTTTEYRAFDLEPGLHTIVITLSGGARWTREIDLQAKSFKCVIVESVELDDVRGTICDCQGVYISNVPWWKRAAARLKGKK